MKIDKNNIEAFLLDYLEGNLDPLLTAELMAFMAENPGYEKWLPGYDGHLCLSEGPSFENKNLLRKNLSDIPQITEENFEEFCIASAEGILQPIDTARLQEYLSAHPESHRDLELYHRLKLVPDMSIVYPHKAAIKRHILRPVALRIIYYTLAAAASVAILLILINPKPAVRKYPVAEINPPVINPDRFSSQAPVITAPSSAKLPVSKHKSAIAPAPDIENLTAPPEEKIIPAPLASLEPVSKTPLLPGNSAPELYQHKPTEHTPGILVAGPVQDDDRTAMKIVAHVIKKLNLWKAAESAVTGFNYLTESKLSISKTTDQNGKLTGLALETEDYTISGNKIK